MVWVASGSVDIFCICLLLFFIFQLNFDFLDLLSIVRRLSLLFLFSHIDVEYFEEVELGDGVDGE